MNLFLEKITQKINLDPEETAYLQSIVQHQQYAKHEYFLAKGQICRKIGFIDTGLVRTFNIDRTGQEITNWLTTDGDFITEVMSFLTQSPTLEYLQCLDDTRVVYLSYSDLMDCYQKIPKMESFIRMLYEELIVDIKKYLLANVHRSAEERYEEFIRKYPLLMEKVPLKHIASFLGITDSTLSRLRRKITLAS